MLTEEAADKLKALLQENLIELKSPKKRRIFVRVNKDSFKESLVKIIDDMKITHLSTITGIDESQDIELLYHFAIEDSISMAIGIKLPKDNLSIPTISDIIPGAVLYEREIHELLGVDFKGHPDQTHMVLPEGWPDGVYPLRKESKFEDLRKIGSR